MTTKELHAALDAIENGDPVAELAARLVENGMTEEQLHVALGDRSRSVIGNELRNKFRDVPRGWTMNHYQKRWSRK